VALDNPPARTRLDVPPERPETTPEERAEQRERARARKFELAEAKEERAFTKRYVEAHQDELLAEDAQQKLIALYEPEPPPIAKKFPEASEARLIAEAVESLAVREPPERLVERLTAIIESIVLKVREVDEQRARDVIREVVKPMLLRLSAAFPRKDFEVPVDPGGDSP
jgi:hypothetical protein